MPKAAGQDMMQDRAGDVSENEAQGWTSTDPTPSAPAPMNAAPNAQAIVGKQHLIARVVDAAGVKKKVAKPVIEAVLQELGEALSRGETLNLQPFGKLIVKTRKRQGTADVVELRLRRRAAAPAPEEPAADPTPTAPCAPDEPLASPQNDM